MINLSHATSHSFITSAAKIAVEQRPIGPGPAAKSIVDCSLSDESSGMSAKCEVLTGNDGKFTLVETNAVKSVVNEDDADPINLVQNGVPEVPKKFEACTAKIEESRAIGNDVDRKCEKSTENCKISTRMGACSKIESSSSNKVELNYEMAQNLKNYGLHVSTNPQQDCPILTG